MNTLLLIQMVAARMGIAALPHWVVESFERRAWWSPKHSRVRGYGAGCTRPLRDGEQRQPVSRSVYSLCAEPRLRSSAVCPECGATQRRWTRGEARITNAPLIKLGQCGCSCQMARLHRQPGGDMDVIRRSPACRHPPGWRHSST